MLRKMMEEQSNCWNVLGAPYLFGDFILKVADLETDKVGRFIKPDGTEKSLGQIKQCFWNAGDIVLNEMSDRYDYVEGFVVSKRLPIPIHHAWVYDTEKEIVIEPTLRNLSDDTWYLGKRFSYPEYQKVTLAWGYWCVFDSPCGPNMNLMKSMCPEVFNEPA